MASDRDVQAARALMDRSTKVYLSRAERQSVGNVISAQRDMNARLLWQLQQMHQHLAHTSEQHIAVTQQVHAFQSNIHGLRSALTEQHRQNQQLLDQLHSAGVKNNELEQLTLSLDANKNALEKQASSLEATKAKLEAQANELSNNKTTLQKQVDDMEALVREQEQRLEQGGTVLQKYFDVTRLFLDFSDANRQSFLHFMRDEYNVSSTISSSQLRDILTDLRSTTKPQEQMQGLEKALTQMAVTPNAQRTRSAIDQEAGGDEVPHVQAAAAAANQRKEEAQSAAAAGAAAVAHEKPRD